MKRKNIKNRRASKSAPVKGAIIFVDASDLGGNGAQGRHKRKIAPRRKGMLALWNRLWTFGESKVEKRTSR